MQPRSPPTFGAPPSPPLIAQRQAAPQMYQADSAMRPDTPFHRLSLPSFSVGATVGSILLLISIIGVVLNSTGVAYYSQNVGSNQNEDWEDGDYDDLKDADSESTVDTMEILYKTPATLFVVGIILGAILIFSDFTPSTQGVKSIVSAALFSGTILIGFFLLLSGSTWLGWYLSIIMSTEDELRWHLSAVPYFFVLAGLILVLWPMRPLMAEFSFLTGHAVLDDRTLCFGLFSLAKRTLFASAICLVLLPIAPVFYEDVKNDGGDESNKDFIPPLWMDIQYDSCQESDGECYRGDDALEDVINAMHHSTTAMWWVFWASICFVFIALFTAQSNQLGRACENIFHLHGLLIIPVIIGLVYSVIMYVNIPDMSGGIGDGNSEYNIALNWFMPVTFTYLLVVWFANQLPKTLLPWARQLQANRQAAIMATHNMAYQMQMQAIQRPQIQQQAMPPQQQVPQGPPQSPSEMTGQIPYDPTRKY